MNRKTAFLSLLFLLLQAGIANAAATLAAVPGTFGPQPIASPNTTFAPDSLVQVNTTQMIGGACSNTGGILKHWSPANNSTSGGQPLDFASGSEYLVSPYSGRYAGSLKAASACSDGVAWYLKFSPTATSLMLSPYSNPTPQRKLTTGQNMTVNGSSIGVFQDAWGLKLGYAQLIVGAYYYPTDDAANLYQGILQLTPGSGDVQNVLYRIPVSQGKNLVLEGANGSQIYWTNTTDQKLMRVNGSGLVQTILTGVTNQQVSVIPGQAVVAYTNASGLQVARVDSNGVISSLVANGKVGTQPIGAISSISGIVDHGFYAVSQLSSGVKGMISVIDGVYTEIQREDQAPTGQMLGVYNSPLNGAPNPYVVLMSGGQTVAYQVTQPSANPLVASVNNAASYLAPKGAATNSFATIYGNNVALSTAQPDVTAITLPLTLGGATVLVDVNGQQIAAPISYTNTGQINFLVPDLGNQTTTSFQLKLNDGRTSQKLTINVAKSDPGIFQWKGSAIVTDLANRLLNPEVEGMHDGQIYTLWATGLGPTNPSAPINQPAPLVAAPLTGDATLKIDGVPADVLYAGITPNAIGLYQINVRVHASPGFRTANAVLTLSDGNTTTFTVTVQ